MQTRPVDTSNTEQFHLWYELLRGADLAGRPVDAPFFSERQASVMFSRPDPTEELAGYAAFDADTIVAAGFTALPLLDNTDKAFVYVAVPTSQRRRGLGSLMLADLIALCERVGRTTLLSYAWIPAAALEAHPHRRFAEKNGFALANVEVRRVLHLPVPSDRLRAWAEQAASHHGDYQLLTFVDTIPDELLESLCHARNQLAVDAPTGDIELEEEAMTPTEFQEREAIRRESGITSCATLAVDGSGTTVAYTTMGIAEDEPQVVHQWGTLVLREHRGHRLGMAVKVANVAAVQAAFPERTVVSTTNSETNSYMVDINEELGFRRVELLAEFQRLAPRSGGLSPERPDSLPG